jgi:4-amino-4-deoxy-L-arabinose transferase-like glycosyltransferase
LESSTIPENVSLRRRDAGLPVIWAVVVIVALFLHIGDYPLYDADEGRNGEVAREMAATNDFVLPHLNGLPYLDKPVVFFAATALAMKVLGPTETAARLPAFLFMLLSALLTGWFAVRLEEFRARAEPGVTAGAPRASGWLAGIITMAMPLSVAFSRTVIFDSALTFFILLAIVGFWCAIEARLEQQAAGRWTALAWAAIALGVLTKGPVAILLPLLVALPYAIWRRAARSLFSIAGLLLFVLIVAPWVAAVSQKIPDFLHYVLVTETAARLATSELKRTGPPWYFIPYLLGGAFPWSIALLAGLPGAVRERWAGDWRRFVRENPSLLFLILWIVLPFLFFSLSQSKRPQYILPVIPAVALLIVWLWRREEGLLRGARAAAALLAVTGLLITVAAFIPRLSEHLKEPLVDPAHAAAVGIGLVAFASGLLALVFQHSRRFLVIALTLPILEIPLAGNSLLKAIGESRSTKTLVGEISRWVRDDTHLVAIREYESTLPFYLHRPIDLASDDGSELTSNYMLRHYAEWSVRPDSTLHSLVWSRRELLTCCPPTLFFVRTKDLAMQHTLYSYGARQIADNDKLVVFARGPSSAPPLGGRPRLNR